MRPEEILEAAAATFRERNAVYADNYKKVGEVMAALFPDGVTLKNEYEFKRWHIFELIVIKLTRLVNAGFDHRDSIRDIAVYAAILEAIVTERQK
jgi:hypothetical protein